ncbi:Ras protein [Oopsacas minuta]|uniref:Ras protein n=1 Tax=Oopsacas minuta TaxID=111878 RepID=A0AAV7KJG9_9METZ|nr:Ras protein [Oopsacas minuta]
MKMKREQIKILMLGVGAVEEVYEAPARVKDSLYILQILDTAGTDECGIIREEFYHQCDGYLLVFSVIDRFNLQEIREIQKDIKR